MKSYIEKVLSDGFYKYTYKYLGKNALANAGFLYDKNSTDKTFLELEKESFKLFTMNFNKVINNIGLLSEKQVESIKAKKKCYILLSTGSFNPVHKGHIKMFDLAVEKLEKNGQVVIGAYLSPSHDSYVFTKDERFKLSASDRISLCEKLIDNHSLLSTDSWESLCNISSINFTDVIERLNWLLNLKLENYIEDQLGEKISIEVVYVFGSDNYTFMDAFIKNGTCVCVPRNQEDVIKCEIKKSSINHFGFNKPNDRILISEVGENISSTEIRNNALLSFTVIAR